MRKRSNLNVAQYREELLVLNKRALSPIFATLIILAVVTVLFIPVFIWATGIGGATQDSWQESSETATQRIIIEEVNLKFGQTNCTVYVRNIGITNVEINNILIQKTDGSGSIYPYDDPQISCDPPSAVQGQLITVFISSLGSFTPENGAVYTVKAYSTRGVGDAYQVVM
jgi:flagellin-like protein